MTSSTPHQVDRLVIGDVAGMTASFIDKRESLSVLLCEKAPYVGSITATSGGTAWVPGTHLSRWKRPCSAKQSTTCPPHPEFMGLGGMMINCSEIDALLNSPSFPPAPTLCVSWSYVPLIWLANYSRSVRRRTMLV